MLVSQTKTTAQALTMMGRFNSKGADVDAAAQIKAAERAAVQGIVQDQAQNKAHGTFQRAAIPPRFATRRLDNYYPVCDKAANVLAIAKQYANDFEKAREEGRCLIFTGNKGTGKTHLATAIANDIMSKGRTAYFLTVLEATRLIKETFRRDSIKTESQVFHELISPDLLILDEVGVQYGSEAEKQILFEVINGRYMQMKPTILMGNLTLPEMAEVLTERVMDRLREGGGRALSFDWDSYRSQA